MKRNIARLLCVVMIFGLFGCGQSDDRDLIEPVSFYYCNDLASKEDFSNVFVPELREGYGYEEDPVSLLNLYISGPENNKLTSPFPAGLKILTLRTPGSKACITLSEHAAKLRGMDLTLASTCLCLTLFELLPVDTVEISISNSLIDDQESVTITKDNLIFEDGSYPTTEN